MTEETYIGLDKRLFELFLSLSRCLGSVEELLQRPGLLREDASAQQVFFQVGHSSCPCVCLSAAPQEAGAHCLPLRLLETGSRAEEALFSSGRQEGGSPESCDLAWQGCHAAARVFRRSESQPGEHAEQSCLEELLPEGGP